MAKVKYMHINFFSDYVKRLKRKGETFEVVRTSYTRRIKTKNLVIFFNEEGSSDHDSLGLINMVRENAREYLSKTSFEQRESHIHFSELISVPNGKEVIFKIDIRSAYWEAAMKKGVIEESTNRKLLEIYNEEYEKRNPERNTAKDMKMARLKALGSLATRKITEYYEDGKKVHEEPYTEPTKELYLDICREVDNLMRSCVEENHRVVFYYWDCIFVPEDYAAGVVSFFKDKEYEVSVEKTTLELIRIADTHWVLSRSDDKAYMVKRESRGLIEGLY